MAPRQTTKHIKTRRTTILGIFDKLVWIVPLLFMVPLLARPATVEALQKEFSVSPLVGFAVLIIILVCYAAFYLPLMTLWRAVSRPLWETALEKSSFTSIDDVEYYRDILSGVSPAAISLLTDLEIETHKDLAAQILRYTMDGLVNTDGNTLQVLSIPASLPQSDQFLLQALAAGKTNQQTLASWSKLCTEETIAQGLIQTRTSGPFASESGKSLSPLIRTGCLPGILAFPLLILFYLAATFAGYIDELDRLDQLGMTNAEFLEYLTQNPLMGLFALSSIALFILFFVGLVSPVALLIYYAVKKKATGTIERTPQGEALTEKIYGLKNFVRDFTALSDADKKKLILWDDFLIYAVLFEENTRVTNEILSLRGLAVPEVSSFMS